MASAVEAAEIAGHQPTVDNGFRCEFWLIQVTRHDGFAAHSNFADAIRRWIHDAHFHSGQRLADSVRAKRFQIVDGDRRSGFCKSVSVGDRNPQIVEKLQRLRFSESAADNDRAQLSAKCLVDLLEQDAADAEAGPGFFATFFLTPKSIANF